MLLAIGLYARPGVTLEGVRGMLGETRENFGLRKLATCLFYT